MKHKPTPDPPHILDYLARIKVEGTNVAISVADKMHTSRMDRILNTRGPFTGSVTA